jgi:hypothetical protein
VLVSIKRHQGNSHVLEKLFFLQPNGGHYFDIIRGQLRSRLRTDRLSTNDDSVVDLGTIELKKLSVADFQINKK